MAGRGVPQGPEASEKKRGWGWGLLGKLRHLEAAMGTGELGKQVDALAGGWGTGPKEA